VKLLSLSLLALAAGCATDPQDPVDATETRKPPRIEVLLTDAPGDFESVWVTIASVSIESAEAGWMTLVDQPQKYDLLTLRNDVTAALGGATLEPGTYGQLRLLVESASVVVDGVESPLEIASGAQTGIKIPLDQTLEANTTYSLTLDYDAAKSVKSTGKGYLMTPVIHVKDFTATPVATEEPAAEEPMQESSEEPIL
jgi:hypothetical protein